MARINLKETTARSPAPDAYSAIVLADSPYAYWRLGETSGTQVTDSSGNGRHGTYSSNYSLNQTSPIAGSTLGCVRKTATGGFLMSLPTSSWPASSAVTMECWTKWSASTMTSYGFYYAGASSERVFMTHFPWTDGIVYFDAGDEGGGTHDRISWDPDNIGLTVTSGWHHWVFIKNETTDEQKIYVDGILRAEGSSLTRTGMTTTTVTSGNTMNGWYGYLSDVAIYNYELTQAQIDEHYQAGRYGSAGAGYGEIWAKTGSDAAMMFTNDQGVAGGVLSRENGVFAPKIWDISLSDSESQTYNTSNTARYEVINGRLCIGNINLDLTSKGSISGSLVIGNLPHTVATMHGMAYCEQALNLTGFDSTNNKIVCYPVYNTNYIKLMYNGGTGGITDLLASHLTNTTFLNINFAYMVY